MKATKGDLLVGTVPAFTETHRQDIWNQVRITQVADWAWAIVQAETFGWIDTSVCTLSAINWIRTLLQAPRVPIFELDHCLHGQPAIYLPRATAGELSSCAERARYWMDVDEHRIEASA